MRAIVLAAGMGTRLLPLTRDRPKCLVELVGKSLLERQIAVLRRVGIDDISVVTGYRSDRVKPPGVRIFSNPEYGATNMVESLFCARSVMTADRNLIVAYGDIVYERRVLEALMACTAPVCLAIDSQWRRYWQLRMDDPLRDAETLRLDANGLVREIGKKPRSYDQIQGQYTGLIKVRAADVPRLVEAHNAMDRSAIYDGRDFRNMYMTSFLQHLIDDGWPVRAVLIENGWLEVDTAEDLSLYERMYRDGSLDRYCVLD